MGNNRMLVKAGTFLSLERGELGAEPCGPYRVLKDFYDDEMVEAFLAQWVSPEDWRWPRPRVGHFGDWLTSTGILEALDVLVLDIDERNSDRRFDKS